MLRGNGGQKIFFTDDDRYYFELLVEEGVNRFGHRIPILPVILFPHCLTPIHLLQLGLGLWPAFPIHRQLVIALEFFNS